MKKLLLLSALILVGANSYSEGFNHYLKLNIETAGSYDVKASGISGDADSGFGISYELTKNLNDKFELGLGIAYESHGSIEDTIYLSSDYFTYKADDAALQSVPLYALVKYNFNTNTEIKPYVKGFLGYSFNFDNVEDYGNSIFDVTNGTYYGVGVGVEYKKFIFDVSYSVNGAEVKIPGETVSCDYSKVSFGIGYKF